MIKKMRFSLQIVCTFTVTGIMLNNRTLIDITFSADIAYFKSKMKCVVLDSTVCHLGCLLIEFI